jgi:hypothetical protein
MPQEVWEKIKVQGAQVLSELQRIVHEGNVRRVVVKQGASVVAEFPLTVGVVGALAAPVLAAVGALVALLTDCTIEVERQVKPSGPAKPRAKSRTAGKD